MKVPFYAPLETVVSGLPYDGDAEITASGFCFSIASEQGGGLLSMVLLINPDVKIPVTVDGRERLGCIISCKPVAGIYEVTIALPVDKYDN